MTKRLRAAVVTGLFGLVIILANVGLKTSANPETFGNTAVGTTSVKPSANYKFGGVYTLDKEGQAQSFSWYVSGGVAEQKFKPVVYATDPAGEPTTLLITGQETTIAANQPAGWVTADLPDTTLQPGKYYLGLLSGPGTQQANIFYTPIATRESQYNANPYPTPTDTFGTIRKEAKKWSYNLTYMPAGQEPGVAPENTVAPTVVGIAEEAQTLSATTGEWTGQPAPTLATQWQRCTDICSDISGATAHTYVLVTADVGATVRVVVTATNGAGSAQAVSEPTATVMAIPAVAPSNVTPVAITGIPEEAQTLSATPGVWEGSPTPTVATQWQRCNETDCQDIAGATTSTYDITTQDIGFMLRVVEQATNTAGSMTVASAPTATATAIPNAAPGNTTLPAITGYPVLNQTLTATAGEWTGRPTPELTGEWQRCLVELCVTIDGATAATHQVAGEDVGSQLRFRVVATNIEGMTEAYSEKTGVVTANGKPSFAKHSVDSETVGVMSAKALTDINGDGKKDAVIGYRKSTQSSGGIWWYEHPASGNPADTWTKRTILPQGDVYEDLITHDVDGDGLQDIVASIKKLDIYWYKNPGTTTDTWQQFHIGTGVGENNMLFADLDGDSKQDLATNSAIFFQDTPTSWVKKPMGNSWLGMALIDSGSGLGQVNFVRNSEVAPYDIVWHQNPREWGGNARTDQWLTHRIGAGYACKSSCATVQVATIHSGDMNGDGRLDVVIANAEAGALKAGTPGGVRWYEAPVDRTTPWTHHFVDAAYNNVHNMRLVDMDHNGALDIVGGEQDQTVQRRFGIFYNDGTGTFVYESIEAGVGTHNIDVEDLEGDGDWDIIQGRHGWYGDDNPLSIYVAQ